MPLAKGARYPRKPCDCCGLEATHDTSGTHPREHRCPHGNRCDGLRFVDINGVQHLTGMPFRDVRGVWVHCPWCTATALVERGMSIVEEPDWLERLGRSRRTRAA